MNLTTYTAIIATITAAITGVILFRDILRSRPKIQIRFHSAGKPVNDITVRGVLIELQNPSAHTVHIECISLIFRIETPTIKDYYRCIRYSISRFKYTPSLIGWVPAELFAIGVDYNHITALEPGTSARVFVPDQKIEKLLENKSCKKLRVCVRHSLGREAYSEKFYYRKVHGLSS